MKRYLFSFACMMAGLLMQAQTHMRIWQQGDDNRMKLANVGEMTFSGSDVVIKGKTYAMSAIDSIVMVPEINVVYNGSSATVSVPKSIQSDVTVTTDGAHVTITNNNVSNEADIILTGSSIDGSLTYNGLYKASFYLNGLSLVSTKGAALDIECGKRIALELVDGTTNRLVDAASGSQKACLYCKGHLEVEGSGSLAVIGNAKHAISTKEYLQLKKSTGTITIEKAAGDAIHCGQYFQMNGGTVNIDSNTAADGIQVETLLLDDETTVDPEKENNGQVIIKGGTIVETIASEDCKGIKCDGQVTITGGTIGIDANGNGSRGIQTDGNMTISQDDNTTNITINAAGGKCTVEADSDDPHKCMGIKVDGNLTVNDGTITVNATGKKAKGIKVGGTYTKNGGTVNATVE